MTQFKSSNLHNATLAFLVVNFAKGCEWKHLARTNSPAPLGISMAWKTFTSVPKYASKEPHLNSLALMHMVSREITLKFNLFQLLTGWQAMVIPVLVFQK